MKKILVINGHPKIDSFCHALSDSYVEGAKKAGNHVKIITLRNLHLEQFLKCEYTEQIDLPEELLEVQELIAWSDHLVFTFPIWWATPPALLKVFLEIVLQPGFAYKYHPPKGMIPKWDMLLKGKSARIIATLDAFPWYYKWLLGNPAGKMMKANLNFCGIKPVKQNYFGSVKMSSGNRKKVWLKQAYKVGEKE